MWRKSDAMLLLSDTDTYVKVFSIRDHNGDAVTVTSASAEIQGDNDSGDEPWPDGSTVADSSISLSQVSGESDAYEGAIPNDVSLSYGSWYWIVVTIVVGSQQTKKAYRVQARAH